VAAVEGGPPRGVRRCVVKRTAAVAGVSAAVGLSLYGSFRLFAWVFDGAVVFVCRRQDAKRERTA
jgi:hypothetical protein